MQSLVIAAIARFVTCMTLQPFTVLKTRFEVQLTCAVIYGLYKLVEYAIFVGQSGWFRYSGMMQAVKEMLRHEGVKSECIK